MKQMKRFGSLLVITVFVASFLSIATSSVNPTPVLAAQCPTDPTVAGGVDKMNQCIDAFRTICKKTFTDKFCNHLGVEEINDCATQGQTRDFDQECLKALQESKPKSEGGQGITNLGENGENRIAGDCKEDSFGALDKDNCGIIRLILMITNVLAGIAGLVIVTAMILGGIQYSMAGAEPSKVQAAKQKIINALLALFVLIFGFAFLQWVVPGGIF